MMVVQCEQCRTRFKLDDSKVGDKGVKVRCSKCRHIFLVMPERADTPDESDIDALFTGLGDSPESRQDEESADFPGYAPVSGGMQAKADVNVGQTTPGPASLPESASEPAEATADTPSFQFSADEYDAPSKEGDSTSPFFAGVTGNDKAEMAVTEPSGSVFPDSNRDVSADDSKADDAEASSAVSSKSQDAEGQSLPDLQEGATSVDDIDSSVAPSDAAEKSLDDGAATMAASAEDSDSSPHVSSLYKTDLVVPKTFMDTHLAADEPPPLAIASRRRSSSLFPLAATAISVIVIIVLAGFGFYMMNEGPEALKKLGMESIAKWAGLDGAQEGSIILRATKSEFMRNSNVGEIFVIRGEAVNAYKKPRGSIQVKATVFGPKGEPVSTRTAYCGNLISNAQLASLPMTRLEAAMGNQFGDSLANLGVQPGKSIPFVIVVSGVPKEASEFGLEVAGSTAANL